MSQTATPSPAGTTPPPALDDLLARIRATFDVDFEPLVIDDLSFDVLSIRNMQSYLDGMLARKAIRNPLKDLPLWAKVWPASFVLGRYLRHFEPQGKRLLELGAGCGTLSLVAAHYGFARIVCTDIVPDALLFTEANVLRNGLENIISVAHLDVTRPGKDPRFAEGFDLVAASEILYLDELHRPLLKFLGRHLAPGGKALFATDLARAKPHFAKLAAKSFRVDERRIGLTSHDEDGKEQRRAYSMLVVERA